MTQKYDDTSIDDILIHFIAEQRQFNEEQKKFNERIDKKIDKVQYYLEESLAQTTKMFFEEQMELKSEIKSLEGQVNILDGLVAQLMSEMKQLRLQIQ